MAISKSKIDFDVYERADPESQIDWGKQAKTISDTFANIAEERETKKAAIEKSFQDQQTALNDIGEYDNQTIQQMVMNGGQDVSNKLLDVKNLVQRGLMKPSDATMWQHNAKTGFDLLKKNASSFDNTFVEYKTRLQEKMENSNLSQGAPGEQWLAKQLEGFAKMNNMTLQADAETGNMVMLRVDPQTGEPIPGDSMSVQHMTLLMKQKINNFDVGNYVKDIKTEMGTITTSMIKDAEGPNVVITEEKRSRAEEEFFKSEDGNEFLDKKVDEIFGNPYDAQSMIVNAGLQTADGTAYEIGSQEDYDKWMAENNNDEANNPYLVMEFGEDNLYHPKFNETQKEAAKEYAKTQITGSLDYSKTQKMQAKAQPRAITKDERSASREQKEGQATFTTLRTFMSAKGADAEASGQEIANMYNRNKGEDDRAIRKITRLESGQFRIIYESGEDGILGDAGGTQENAEKALYDLIRTPEMPKGVDAALNIYGLDKPTGDVTTDDEVSGLGMDAVPEYQTGKIYVMEDGKYVPKNLVDVVDFDTENIFAKNKSPKEISLRYQDVINKDGFLPPTFKADLKREDEQIFMGVKNGQPVFEIRDKEGKVVTDSKGKPLSIEMTEKDIDLDKPELFAIAIQEVIKRKNDDLAGGFIKEVQETPPTKKEPLPGQE